MVYAFIFLRRFVVPALGSAAGAAVESTALSSVGSAAGKAAVSAEEEASAAGAAAESPALSLCGCGNGVSGRFRLGRSFRSRFARLFLMPDNRALLLDDGIRYYNFLLFYESTSNNLYGKRKIKT